MSKFNTKQSQLITNGRVLPFGVYEDLVSDVKTHQIDKNFLSLRRRTERKTWVFFGFYSPEIMCGFAIADAGAMATSFSYIFIPKQGIFEEHKHNQILGFDSKFDPNLYDRWNLDSYSIHSQNNKMTYQTNNNQFKLKIIADNNTNGFSVVAPSKGSRPFNFTYKNLAIPASVEITFKGKEYKAYGNYGSIDFTKSYPPRETFWNWLSCIGNTESGKIISLNLVDQYNDNMENVVYIDNKKVLLSKTNFNYSKPLDKNNWFIKTTDGIIELTVVPNGKRSENINAIVMKSQFTQLFGTISGTITLDGLSEKFTAYGVTEEHYALW